MKIETQAVPVIKFGDLPLGTVFRFAHDYWIRASPDGGQLVDGASSGGSAVRLGDGYLLHFSAQADVSLVDAVLQVRE